MQYDWLTYIGRMAFPIFAFLVVEGFFHTKNIKKYMLRLFVFALLSEIPFNLMMCGRGFYPIHQNVLWTFLLSLIALLIFEKLNSKHILLRIVFYPITIIVFYLLGIVTFVDYYGYGVLTVILFYFTRQKTEGTTVEKVIRMALQFLGLYWIICEMKGLMIPVNLLGMTIEVYRQGFALFALVFIWLYRGQQGLYNRYIRYIYYLFYPVHMLLLWGFCALL